MLNYNTETHSWSEFLDAFNTELKDITFPIKAKHKLMGACELTGLTATDTDIFVSIKFPACLKRFSLSFLFNKGHLELDEPETLFEVLETYNESLKVHDDELRELKKQADLKRQQELDEKKKAEAEEKRRAKIANQIKALKPEALTTDYQLLGWMAKNVSCISATVPSDLEPWFIKNFGSVKHTVVDSDAKTSGGHSMKYSISFKASFKAELPEVLQSKTGVKKKVIDSVAFIWDLIENHGFNFGKSQDLESIKKTVPTTYLSEFETGIA
jgi:hypothetical protein